MTLDIGPNTHHDKSQRLRMSDKPAGHQQSDREQDSNDRKPVSTSPPEGEQKADPKDNTGNFARNDVEATEYKQSADKRGPEIASWKCDGGDASLHVCYSTFPRVELDGFNPPTSAAGCYGVSELVESDNKHLSQR